jgi:hypothetical protein
MLSTSQSPTRFHHPWWRHLLVGVALAATCALIWTLSSSLVNGGLGDPHGGSELERPDPAAVTDDVKGVADLHAHLNYAIWGRDGFDEDAFLATGERTLSLIDDPTTTYLVADALESARSGQLRIAHDQLERAEGRLAQQDR